MEGFGSVLMLILVGFLMLFSHVFEKLARKKRDRNLSAQMPEKDEPTGGPPDIARAAERPQRRSGRSPPQAERVARASVRGSAAAARNPVRQSLTGRENLRRAIVLMTVLGPPVSERKGFEPPNLG